MKIIFLDVDGVLNIMSPSYTTSYFRPDGSVKYMDEHLVYRLNYLIEKTDTNIVISSSWRLDMEDLKEQLELSGFKYWDKVIGATDYNEKHRGEQIIDYLSDYNNISNYVVLEDEIEDVHGDKCMIVPIENVVEVDFRNGLTHQDVEKAIKILEDKFYE